MHLHRVTLIGFISNDAEKKVGGTTVATKASWKTDSGSWESRTDWHRCVAFGKIATFASVSTKGAHVALEGELRSREYDRDVTVGVETTTIKQRV